MKYNLSMFNEDNKVTFYFPAHWASAIIDGDFSGLDDEEEKEVNDTLKHHGLTTCDIYIDAEPEKEFISNPDTLSELACDCIPFYCYLKD